MTDPPVDSTDEAHEQLARLGAFARRTLRFWRTAIALLALGGFAGAVFLFFRKPTYRSETVILYSEGVRPADDTDRPDTSRSVTVRLKEILMSRSSLDAVVREFDLYPDVRQTKGPIDAVEELRKHVEFRAPGGDTFSIAFVGASPSEAERVTARLAEIVIAQDSDLRKKQALVARDFLETEKRTTESHLRDAEQELAAFMGAHPRFALDATPLVTGAAIRASMGASAASPALPGARSRIFVPPRATTTPGSSASETSRASAGDGREAGAEEARAAAALAAAQANLAELATRFTAAHPDVRAAQAEMDRSKARLAAATAAVVAAPKPQVASAPAQAPASPPPALPPRQVPVVTPVGDSVGAPPANAAPRPAEHDVVALETDWVKLTRGVTEARQHQDQVEGALFKANIAVSSESGGHGVQVTMIDPAFLPQSAMPPGRAVIAAMFLGVSLLLGFICAALRAFLDDRVYDGRDVARLTEILAEVPRASTRRAHVAG
jgi:capsular polysaccharide biosynthesis protein